MRKLLRDGLVFLLLAVAAFSASNGAATAGPATGAPPPPPTDQSRLAGPWRGTWTSGGFIYGAVMVLTVDAQGAAEGSIDWTLRASPRPNESGKIGMTGVEHVRGKFYPETNTLVVDGYSKDDPNVILGLDKYRLVVSEDRKTMGGITWDHGSWAGQFYLSR